MLISGWAEVIVRVGSIPTTYVCASCNQGVGARDKPEHDDKRIAFLFTDEVQTGEIGSLIR